VSLMASFALMALGGEKKQLEGAVKYVVINLIGSTLFLSGVGLLYGLTGTLNMADLSIRLKELPGGLSNTISMLFLLAFGIKAAVFPLFFWLPASYHTPPVSVSAIFAGLLTKVGVYALIRIFTLLFVVNAGSTHAIILTISGFTMITGVLGALVQWEFRRLLSFHIISQIGYMIMGLGLFTTIGLAGSIFYIMHHIIVKTNLFLVSGVVYRLQGSFHLKKLGGLYKSSPTLCFCFLIPALSLAGVPPLSGFFAKFILLKEVLGNQKYVIAFILLGVSLLTLFSMMKIWTEVFWKALPDNQHQRRLPRRERTLLLLPIIVLAGLTVLIGIYAEPLYAISLRAAEQLINPVDYVETVLGVTLS